MIFASLTGDVLLDMLIGALLTILCYSSLAVVLLIGDARGAASDLAARWRSASCSAPISAAACSAVLVDAARRRRKRAACRSATCCSS